MAPPRLTERQLAERNARDAKVLQLIEGGLAHHLVAERFGTTKNMITAMATRARKRRAELVPTTTQKDHDHG